MGLHRPDSRQDRGARLSLRLAQEPRSFRMISRWLSAYSSIAYRRSSPSEGLRVAVGLV
jgi:hypothetical protein